MRHSSTRSTLLGWLACAIAAFALWPSTVHAQWYPYPYSYRAYGPEADVRLLVSPKEAAVYVDGYYAGIVDDFDGVFQRLHLTPGAHEIVLYLSGYRTVRHRIYASPGDTLKLRDTMAAVGAGDTSEAPPSPAPPQVGVPGAPPETAPPGTPRMPPPRRGPDRRQPMPPAGQPSSEFGTLSIRVQPPDADVFIDGEPWHASMEDGARLLVQVGEGRHRLEVRKDGYATFSREFDVRAGETTPVNVSLTPE